MTSSLPLPTKTLKAFLYRRKSNEEQSNWSVSGQLETLELHVRRNGIEIIGDYEDDGFTASNFDRPGWKKMVKDIGRKKPDVVLCTKYNRIVRRAGLGLSEIERLEGKHRVIFIAVTEMPFVDPKSAVFHKFRGDLFITADFEWRQGRDVSMHGTWSAHKQGRQWAAPWGWVNARDASNSPIIVVDEEKRHVLMSIGKNRYELGLPVAEVKKLAREMGWGQAGKMAMNRILENPTNFGLVSVPAYKDYPAEIVRGVHEALWPEKWYYAHVAAKPEPTATVRMQYDEDAYLRNAIACPDCGRNLTAYWVEKKSGKRYLYYKCQKSCVNYSAVKKHDQLLKVLSAYKFQKEVVDTLLRLVEKELADRAYQNKRERAKATAKAADLEERMDNIEEARYGLQTMDATTYAKWRGRYERDIDGLRLRIAEIDSAEKHIETNKISVFADLDNLAQPFKTMNAATKQRLLALLFGKMVATKTGYLTERIPLLFGDKPLSLNELESPSVGGYVQGSHITPASTRNGASIELLVAVGGLIKSAS